MVSTNGAELQSQRNARVTADRKWMLVDMNLNNRFTILRWSGQNPRVLLFSDLDLARVGCGVFDNRHQGGRIMADEGAEESGGRVILVTRTTSRL